MTRSNLISRVSVGLVCGVFWSVCGVVTLKADEPAGTVPVILKVEEDWELSVGEPVLTSNAPQVSMVMTPFSSIDDYHFLVLLNHHTHPEYVPGGIQVQLWRGETLMSYHNGPQSDMLNHSHETVKWTQQLELNGANIHFKVINGQSNSWGNFGGQGYLQAMVPTNLTNLITYNPYVTLQESGITYAGNRVASLTLKQIRWYTNNGQTYQVSAPIDIDTDLDPWQ